VRLVAYYRVNQKPEGETALGLDAQRAAVEAFARHDDGEVVAEYTEVEVGRRSRRPELVRAITHVKGVQGTLVVARLDRLVRNMAFTAKLLESGIDFVCCDNPHANKATIHILAAVAEDETRRISERTKTALKAARARGVKLGSSREGHWEGHEDRRLEGARRGLPMAVKAASEARMIKTLDAYKFLLPRIVKMRDEERMTLSAIAERINEEGHKTTADLPFTPTMIIRLLRRANALKPGPKAPPPELPADFSDLPLFRHAALQAKKA
jgi:DNA invertase Pin-like site-specific DNA recombinase